MGERQVHPLASTSVSDMLEEFSAFKYHVILIGYALMVRDESALFFISDSQAF